jgi:transposase
MIISGNSVGIDYHKDFVHVCVLSQSGELEGSRKLPNDTSIVQEYISRFGSVGSVALEASTGSANFADELILKTGWEVKQCHPGYVNRMKNNPDKTDKGDSFLISDLNRVGYLPEVWLAPESIRELRSLVRYRNQQIQERTRIKLRIQAILRDQRIVRPKQFGLWTKKGIAWLSSLRSNLQEQTSWIMGELLIRIGELVATEKRVTARLMQLAEEDSLIQHLMSYAGVGIVSATTMRAEIGTFTRFRTGRQLSRFCGVSPRNASSGSRQADAGMIRAGNPILKTCLIQSAQLMIRHDTRWKEFSNRLKARGKPHSVVAAAVANRWLRKLFYHVAEYEGAK